MASLFPYNQISQIPTRILDSIQPLINEKTEELNKLTTDLQNSLLSISPNSNCNDSDILQLKALLRNLQTVIDQIQSIFQFVPIISGTLRFLINFATTSANAQLLIPMTPGVPNGPLIQFLNTFLDIITISSACINVLASSIEIAAGFLEKIFNITAQTNSTISNICGGNISTNSPDTTLLTDNITLTGLEKLYPSDFYKKVNVSDEDLQRRFDAIQELILNQIDVVANLNEAPSRVLYGSGVPTSIIGQIGDYYIDTTDQTVYGPKTNSDSWL
jgi:hypothetical protein